MKESTIRPGFVAAFCAVLIIVSALVAAGCTEVGRNAIKGSDNSTGAETSVVILAGQPGPLRSDYAPGEITRIAGDAIRTANESFNRIAASAPGERTFDTTVLAFEKAGSDLSDAISPLVFMGSVHPDPAIAAEGMECRDNVSSFFIETYTRRDLYTAMKGQVPRTMEETRLYDTIIRGFEENGLKLPDDRLARVRSMQTELSRLETRYLANLNNDNTTLEFTAEELEGVPAEVLATFRKTGNGSYLVTTKSVDYYPVMVYADRSETRKKMSFTAKNVQADENIPLLEEAIVLRRDIARELRYETWADYRIEGRMAGSPENVTAFLEDLKEPLREKTREEFAALLAIKQNLSPGAVSIDAWDLIYLEDKHRKALYAYDSEEVRKYFPLEPVLQKMFSLYGPMFGIEFSEMKNASVWAPDVRLFRITNSTDGTTVAFLYLDLSPREGKYPDLAHFTIISGRRQDNGTYAIPVSAIVGNFRAADNDTPSLLTVDDVVGLFHETGHAMHALLTRAPYSSLSGTNVERDFVETPSQALEEWVYDPEILEYLSGYSPNTSEKLPEDLRDRIIASRNVSVGSDYSFQVMYAMEDMVYHTADGPVNATNISDSLYLEMYGIPPVPGSHTPAQFGHVMDGYDAGYYSYLWSKVYALNIVEEFKQDGMRNATTGMRLRTAILEQGDMQDGMVLLENFLGRKPGTDVLYPFLGIEPPARR